MTDGFRAGIEEIFIDQAERLNFETDAAKRERAYRMADALQKYCESREVGDVRDIRMTAVNESGEFVVSFLCYEISTPDENFMDILSLASDVAFFYHNSEYFIVEIRFPTWWEAVL